MRRLFPALFLLVALPATANLKWNDALRDVYVNGTLTREAQTLVSEHRLAYLAPGGETWIFDGDAHEVVSADRAIFTFNDDRTAATTPDTFATQHVAALAVPEDSTLLATIGATSILVYPHQSHAGPMTEEALWATAPVWKSIHDHYAPDPNVMAKLRAIDKPARVTVVLATWCGDSKKAVPRLLKALHEAGNPLLRVELVGIGPEFLTPLDYVRDRKLTNVPTMIVERGGKEIGRVVETPATATVEQDVAMILAGEPLPSHPGRYERGAMVAQGRYEHRDAHGKTATETWELYERKNGGLLAHSLIVSTKSPSTTVETFAALDARRAPDSIEVTRRDGEHVVRTRASADHGKWTVRARGDERGLVEQTLALPRAVVLPATLTFGWPLLSGEPAVDVFVLDEKGVVGAVEKALVSAGTEPVQPLRRRPRHVVSARSLRYSLSTDSALNVPVDVRLSDGSERHLVGMKGSLPRGSRVGGGPPPIRWRRDGAKPAGETPARRAAHGD